MEKERLYETIISNLPYGFMAVDHNGITIDFNKAAEQITGFTREEVIGKSHMELFHKAADKDACPLWRHAFEHQHDMLSVEHVITKKNGEQAILSVSIAPLFDEDGSFVGGIELLHDVTDQKKRERERKNVLSMFAHDMKNSVLIASGFVSRLEARKSGPLTEEQCSDLWTVRQELSALEKMIFDFLQFSRFEANECVPVKSLFSIAEALAQCVETVRGEAKEKNIRLNIHLPHGAEALLKGDKEMIKRVIMNLLDNAIKYTHPGGSVTARLFLLPDRGTVEISDTGIGIPQEKVPLIFDAFFRADKTTKGSGLGLFIVKTIIDAHDGSVTVKSVVGKGSTFAFSLPF
ncbi:MAG TPA: ATP-binding protein [Dissulfurispiraceae bacterium]|nr:ATP-binding protein [Dissulfurispiraceae bacterium]